MDKRKVIIVDKASYFRDALKNTLLSIGNVEIIAEASTGHQFIDLLDLYYPDIVFMDYSMQGMNGVETTKIALEKNPDMAVIAFSTVDKQCYVNQMVAAGVKGFLSTSKNNYDMLCRIIENPKKGGFFSLDFTDNT